MTIDRYELYYFDTLIANFTINEYGYISYNPLEDGIVVYKDQILICLQKMFNGTINEIPFIQSRIERMKRFKLNILKYETDNYLIKKLND